MVTQTQERPPRHHGLKDRCTNATLPWWCCKSQTEYPGRIPPIGWDRLLVLRLGKSDDRKASEKQRYTEKGDRPGGHGRLSQASIAAGLAASSSSSGCSRPAPATAESCPSRSACAPWAASRTASRSKSRISSRIHSTTAGPWRTTCCCFTSKRPTSMRQ